MTISSPSVIWHMTITSDGVVFSRTLDGCVDMLLTPVSHGVAAVYAAAIVQGFVPPRCACDPVLAGQIATAPYKSLPAAWEIEIKPKYVVFRRIHEGRVIESYCPQPHGLAAISAALVAQGYEPLRCLVPFGKPLG